MRFGINTFLWTKTFSAADLGLIEHVQSLGADGIEFARYGFDGFPVEAIRAELDRLGMGCTFCTAPYEPGLSVIHPSPGARRHGLAYLRQAIGVASRLGVTALTGPLYAKADWFTGARRREAEWGWAVEASACGPSWAPKVLAFGMGTLNAALGQIGGEGIGLTYVTGALVKFGQGFGHWLTGTRTDLAWLVQAAMWASILLGACLATMAMRLGFLGLWPLPLLGFLLAGFAAVAGRPDGGNTGLGLLADMDRNGRK